MSSPDYHSYPVELPAMIRQSPFYGFTEEGKLRNRVEQLEMKLKTAEKVIEEARPLADVLSQGAVLIGHTLCVTSALSRALKAYDEIR